MRYVIESKLIYTVRYLHNLFIAAALGNKQG